MHVILKLVNDNKLLSRKRNNSWHWVCRERLLQIQLITANLENYSSSNITPSALCKSDKYKKQPAIAHEELQAGLAINRVQVRLSAK